MRFHSPYLRQDRSRSIILLEIAWSRIYQSLLMSLVLDLHVSGRDHQPAIFAVEIEILL